jgi:hypothetical protein
VWNFNSFDLVEWVLLFGGLSTDDIQYGAKFLLRDWLIYEGFIDFLEVFVGLLTSNDGTIVVGDILWLTFDVVLGASFGQFFF